MKKVIALVLCVGMFIIAPVSTYAYDDAKTEFDGKDYEDANSKMTVIATKNNIDVVESSGPITLTIHSLAVEEFELKSEENAQYLQLETNRPYALVAMYVDVENTSDNDVQFTPLSSFILPGDKEQVRCSAMTSTNFEGTYYGNVLQTGLLAYILPKTDPRSIETVKFIFDSPRDLTESKSYDGIRITIDLNETDEAE